MERNQGTEITTEPTDRSAVPTPGLSPLAGIVWGALGGLLGAMLGHVSVILAHRWTGDADVWLKGPHGPPFFDLTLSTGIFYGALGLTIYSGSIKDRLRGGAVGFCASFFSIALPMMLATYLFSWGEDPKSPETGAWIYWVIGTYVSASATAAIALGFFTTLPRSGRAAFGAAIGAGLAWSLQFAARVLFPRWGEGVEVFGFLPPPSALTSGALWGAFISLGIGLGATGRRAAADL